MRDVKRNSQSGSAVLVLILVIVVLLVVIVAGAFVFMKSTNDSNEGVGVLESSNSIESSEPLTKDFLEIPELGVKVRLNADSDDLVYYVDGDTVVLSSTSLTEEEPMCAADFNDGSGIRGVGRIDNFTDPNAKALSYTNAETYPDAVKVGNKYYYITTNPSFCVNSGSKNSPEDRAYQLEEGLVKHLRGDAVLEAM